MKNKKNNPDVQKTMVDGQISSMPMPSSGTLLSSSNPVEEDTALLKDTFREKYKWGFVTDIEADAAPPGLDESTIAFISAKKNEPAWLLAWLKIMCRLRMMNPRSSIALLGCVFTNCPMATLSLILTSAFCRDPACTVAIHPV